MLDVFESVPLPQVPKPTSVSTIRPQADIVRMPQVPLLPAPFRTTANPDTAIRTCARRPIGDCTFPKCLCAENPKVLFESKDGGIPYLKKGGHLYPKLLKVDVRPHNAELNIWTFTFSDKSTISTKDATVAEGMCQMHGLR